MSNPNKHKDKGRAREFTINDVELSEMSFVAQNIQSKQEELLFWQERLKEAQRQVELRCGLTSEKEVVEWGRVFSTGKIFAWNKDEVQNQPGVQTKQSQGVPSPAPVSEG